MTPNDNGITLEQVREELTDLYLAASKGFHISESCGPDNKYWHVSKFRSLEELHAFSDAWTKAMLFEKDATP